MEVRIGGFDTRGFSRCFAARRRRFATRLRKRKQNLWDQGDTRAVVANLYFLQLAGNIVRINAFEMGAQTFVFISVHIPNSNRHEIIHIPLITVIF